MRLFLAVDLSEPVRARVAEAIAAERAVVKAKWARAESLHLTLVFIGELEPERLPEIIARSTLVAARQHTFQLMLEGAGTFGPAPHPRVLWLGVTGPSVHSLAAELTQALDVVSEHAEYHPHLTLARSAAMKGDKALAQIAHRLEGKQFGSWRVQQFTLYETVGGRYRPLATIGLGEP